MIISITKIVLNHPFSFFGLARRALDITHQLKGTPCKAYRKRGIWSTHYTLTLWDTEEDMQAFVRSGAHKEAMRASKQLARELAFYTCEAEALPNWKTAQAWLAEHGRVTRF